MTPSSYYSATTSIASSKAGTATGGTSSSSRYRTRKAWDTGAHVNGGRRRQTERNADSTFRLYKARDAIYNPEYVVPSSPPAPYYLPSSLWTTKKTQGRIWADDSTTNPRARYTIWILVALCAYIILHISIIIMSSNRAHSTLEFAPSRKEQMLQSSLRINTGNLLSSSSWQKREELDDEGEHVERPLRGTISQDVLFPKETATRRHYDSGEDEGGVDIFANADLIAHSLPLEGEVAEEEGLRQQPQEKQEQVLAALSPKLQYCAANLTKPDRLTSMIYWKTSISEQDAQYLPTHITSSDGKFLTFEPPTTGSLQAQRRAFETMLILSVSLGRTLVIPPKQGMPNGKTIAGYEDWFHLRPTSDKTEHDTSALTSLYRAVNIISMEELLQYVALQGYLKQNPPQGIKGSPQPLLPPKKQVQWDNTPDIGLLWQYLRKVGHVPNSWDATTNEKHTECMIGIAGGGDATHGSLSSALKDMWKRKATRTPPMPLDYQGNPVAVNAPTVERLREFVAERKEFCDLTDLKATPEGGGAVLLHIPTNAEGHSILNHHFYSHIFHADWKQDLWTKRLIRDGLRYRDEIFCAAAQIRDQLPQQYAALHIRSHFYEEAHHDVNEDAAWIEKTLESWIGEADRETTVIYIATDEGDPSFFAPLREHFPSLKFASDFSSVFSKMENPYWMEMVEQVVCANADTFVGTYYSTFSAHVHRIRGYMSNQPKASGDGTLLNSYYHSPINAQHEMRTYRALRPPFTMREFPVAWRDIDHGDGLKEWELALDELRAAGK